MEGQPGREPGGPVVELEKDGPHICGRPVDLDLGADVHHHLDGVDRGLAERGGRRLWGSENSTSKFKCLMEV
jgi:hypothetical protein